MFARLLTALWLATASLHAAQTFRVATYNVQNYLGTASGTRAAKSDTAKAKIRESIRALNADVIAFQEMGGTNELLELRESLRREGCDFPHWEHVSASDTNIHVAVLSRFPIVARHPHTDDSFVLFGKRHYVKRGFAEVEIRVHDRYAFTLLTAHLKSKLTTFDADEQELRAQEAALLREKIDAILDRRPNANVVVVGDLNDTRDSKAVRTIIGRKNALIDTRPAEDNGDNEPNVNAHYPPPRIVWTHYYGKEDRFSRIDFILLSKGMAREWVTNETRVLKIPNWGTASDHRPIVATFVAEDK